MRLRNINLEELRDFVIDIVKGVNAGKYDNNLSSGGIDIDEDNGETKAKKRGRPKAAVGLIIAGLMLFGCCTNAHAIIKGRQIDKKIVRINTDTTVTSNWDLYTIVVDASGTTVTLSGDVDNIEHAIVNGTNGPIYIDPRSTDTMLYRDCAAGEKLTSAGANTGECVELQYDAGNLQWIIKSISDAGQWTNGG